MKDEAIVISVEVLESRDPSFSSAEEAIAYRSTKLEDAVGVSASACYTPLQKLFWSEHSLALVFLNSVIIVGISDDGGINIRLGLQPELLNLSSESSPIVLSWGNLCTKWDRSALGRIYQFQNLSKVYRTDDYIYFYFENAPLLMCCLIRNCLNGDLLLYWDETD